MYWLCYCVASCNRYLMLINHPTDGATRGLTLRVRLLGRFKKKKKLVFFLPKNLLSGLFASRVDYGMSRYHDAISAAWLSRCLDVVFRLAVAG